LYAARCAACHGKKGEGGGAPSLKDGVFHQTASDAFIRHAIAHGRSGTIMPAFAGTLSDEEINHLTAYVRTLAQPVELRDAQQLPDQPLVINPNGGQPEFTLRDDFYVPAAQVKAAIEAGKRLIIVDARAQSDYLQAHIPGALSVPFYSVEEYAAKLPKDGTWIVAYCACPHAASGQVAAALRDRGFEKIAVLDEGIRVWIERGYPVKTAE
jgi:rhodanese-related sulfurtransferase